MKKLTPGEIEMLFHTPRTPHAVLEASAVEPEESLHEN
jgi:hypothetical protein